VDADAGLIPVQLRFETGLTGAHYVTREGWREARLSRCPLHPRGGCGFARHGTYERKTPAGTQAPTLARSPLQLDVDRIIGVYDRTMITLAGCRSRLACLIQTKPLLPGVVFRSRSECPPGCFGPQDVRLNQKEQGYKWTITFGVWTLLCRWA
jgi:hypothetical protein